MGELVNAIINACSSSSSEKKEKKELSVFEHPIAHLFIKNMFLSECDNNNVSSSALVTTTKNNKVCIKSEAVKESGISFATTFYQHFQGRLMTHVVASSNRGAFVASALVNVKEVKDQVRKELKKSIKEISSMAEKSKGHTALLNLIQV